MPSSSLPPPPSPPLPLPSFHYPYGPSTRYNSREKPRPQHARHSSYTSIAPVLSTATRAHRRASKSSVSTLSSPSEHSSYSRSPLSRFASTSSAPQATMQQHNNNTNATPPLPATPAKSHRRGSSLQYSPFSDYFTDDARSTDSSLSNTETKRLLVRMHRLQSQLMREAPDTNRDALRIVEKKLAEIELELGALHSQSRVPLDVEDSGLWMDDVYEPEPKGLSSNRNSVHDAYLNDDSLEEPLTIEQFKAERDWFVLRMQELVSSLGQAQSALTERLVEVRDLNELHNTQIEERDTEIEQLRSENEGLRSDLGFEYSELLFLKLQMKSLEVDVDSLDDSVDSSETRATTPKSATKNRILSEMDRWRSDWQDVDVRFKRRRSKYGVSLDRRDSASQDGYARGEGDVEWHLETVKEGRGRVTSLTIKRMDSNQGSPRAIAEDGSTPQKTSVDLLNGTAKKHDPLEATISLVTEFGDTSPEQAPKQTLPVGLDGRNPKHGSGEPQFATSYRKTTIYENHGTQTENNPPIPQDEDGDAASDKLTHNDDEQISLNYNNNIQDEGAESAERPDGTDEDEDDCAITTSSEASDSDHEHMEEGDDDDDEAYQDEVNVAVRPKSAWQELWDSLANLSGMGDDRFED